MNFLYEDFKALGLSAYKHNGLLEITANKPNTQIISAHIDRHGLISLGDDEYVYAAQYIKEIKYGENNKSSRKLLEAISKRFEGESVYAYHPQTGEKLAEGFIQACYPDIRNNDAQFFLEGIPQLEQNVPLAYSRQARFEDEQFKGQIDNAISIAVIYALYEAGYDGIALLTREEEIGKSWLHMAEYLEGMQIETKRLMVLDTSPFNNEDVINDGQVIFRTRDKSECFNDGFVKELSMRCEKMELPYQIKDQEMLKAGKDIDDLGSTELGRLVEGSQGHWNGATIQIPTLMYHTSNETTTAKAIENYYAFLRNILIEDRV